MEKKLFQVDAFTTEVFKGNPAGVVISDTVCDDAYMQHMASEMNLSETAFVTPGDGIFHIRFFTPFAEIPLCGHATLSAAAVLYDQKMVSAGTPIHFKTSRHSLFVSGDVNHLKMDFPLMTVNRVDVTPDFTETTGLVPTELYKTDHGWYLAWFNTTEEIHKAHPRLQHMKHSEFGHLIIATSVFKKEGYDCVVRAFVPALGIDEDPVTGSAQCVIAPIMKLKHGVDHYDVTQVSQRSGTMSVRRLNEERIEIAGNAVIVFEAELR